MHAPCFFDSMKNLLIHQQINWNFNHDKSTQKSDIHVCVYINENYKHGYDKKENKKNFEPNTPKYCIKYYYYFE